MVRKFKTKDAKDLEEILEESLSRVGIKDLSKDKIALLLRLIISGMGNYFFLKPDTLINLGFIQFIKTPNKDELFQVKIIRSENDGIINANTLFRYYKGELVQEKELKEIIDKFVNGLLDYSQEQEKNITSLTRKLNK